MMPAKNKASLEYELCRLCNDAKWSQVTKLIASSPNEARKHHDETPLHIACSHDAPIYVVSDLLAAFPGAALIQDSGERTPLHRSCSFRSREVIQALIYCCPKAASMCDADGRTPLHRSCLSGADSVVVAALVAAFPDAISIRDKCGNTPLHCSCISNGSDAVTKILLEASMGLVMAKNAKGQTPLALLCSYFCFTVDSILRGTFLLRDLERFTWKKICVLVRAAYLGTICTNLPRGKKWRMVHACAGSNLSNFEITRIAMKFYPTQLQERDEDGNLPLHIAASTTGPRAGLPTSNDVRLLEALVQRFPAAAVERNGQGKLPLQLAIEGGKTWESGIETLVHANPAALGCVDVDERFLPSILASLGKGEKAVDKLFSVLKEIPTITVVKECSLAIHSDEETLEAECLSAENWGRKRCRLAEDTPCSWTGRWDGMYPEYNVGLDEDINSDTI